MDKELFGNIMYNGKMINLDKEDIESLKNISSELKKDYESLEQKTVTVFKQ